MLTQCQEQTLCVSALEGMPDVAAVVEGVQSPVGSREQTMPDDDEEAHPVEPPPNKRPRRACVRRTMELISDIREWEKCSEDSVLFESVASHVNAEMESEIQNGTLIDEEYLSEGSSESESSDGSYESSFVVKDDESVSASSDVDDSSSDDESDDDPTFQEIDTTTPTAVGQDALSHSKLGEHASDWKCY